jgi:C-terminal processing protease CtpA/Prc
VDDPLIDGLESRASWRRRGRLFCLIDQGRVERLVVDVRHNGGGDSSVDDPLIDGLESRASWRRRGRLFCLIDSGTFSSAVWTAHDLQRLGAVMVGGPTGGRPNAYGNVQIMLLPNSRLEVSYSTRYFRLIEGADPPSLMPDVPAALTIDDVRTGRDPLLEAALRFTP